LFSNVKFPLPKIQLLNICIKHPIRKKEGDFAFQSTFLPHFEQKTASDGSCTPQHRQNLFSSDVTDGGV
jgi:hypothetical protein